jgi:predicted nucleic acid-binding protein
VLTDTGPLVALLDESDPHHARCLMALQQFPPPMLALLPVLTEAMYLCGRQGGWAGQDKLWTLVERGALVLGELEPRDLARARELMRQYRDIPMDFADAALVAYAEREKLRQIFTLDRRGFSTYRLRGGRRLVILP